MSHNIKYSVYPEKINKRKVKEEWDDIAADEGRLEGATGLYREITWYATDPLFDQETAEKWIQEHDRGDYDQLAVRFYAYDSSDLHSKKLDDAAARRIQCMQDKKFFLNNAIDERKKKAYVSCKECGSKLATGYLWLNICPVCKGSLLSEAQEKKIAAFEIKAKKYAEIANEENRKLKAKQKSKATVMWLVKTEYHT